MRYVWVLVLVAYLLMMCVAWAKIREARPQLTDEALAAVQQIMEDHGLTGVVVTVRRVHGIDRMTGIRRAAAPGILCKWEK